MKLSKRISSSTKRAASKKSPRDSRPSPATSSDLKSWQRLMHTAITRPLTDDDRMQAKWIDGRPIAQLVNPLVKGNDFLPSVERLQIYNRMYWYRLLDCIADDSPGLRAFLGDTRYWKLVQAYVAKYPSRSYTLRNLCSRLSRFIAEEPRWTAPHTRAALDIARFEWAQIVAFDGPSLKPFSRKAIAQADPETLRVSLQPYLTLLRLQHAVDEYVVAVKQGDTAMRGEASQAVISHRGRKKNTSANGLKTETIDVVVHRSENILYYKRLEPSAALLLRSLARGQPIAVACALSMRTSRLAPEDQAKQIRGWFSLWMRLGWLCPRE